MVKQFRRAALCAAALVLILTGTAGAATFSPGSAGLGDPFFPNAGNGGYDVSHYSLTLGYEPAPNRLAGTEVITATATQDLSRFNLDLRGFTISRLVVNGAAATFTRERAGARDHTERRHPSRNHVQCHDRLRGDAVGCDRS